MIRDSLSNYTVNATVRALPVGPGGTETWSRPVTGIAFVDGARSFSGSTGLPR